jgi:cytochrome c oxidase subunit II
MKFWALMLAAFLGLSERASAESGTFMPPRGTLIAGSVDGLYQFLLISSLISFVMLIGGMCYFGWKYRRRTATDKTAYITHDHTLEFLWSFIPFLIFIFVFFWGWKIYHDMRSFPKDSLEIHAFAKKWEWRFMYKNGMEARSGLNDKNEPTPPTLVVPVGKPIKMIMASEQIVANNPDRKDAAVLHSFYVPAFRIKQDVVPGRYTAVWFQAEEVGEYWIFCTEYCGAGHYSMKGKIKVVPQDEFERWIAGDEGGAVVAGGNDPMALAKRGKVLYQNNACIGCHSLDGKVNAGPSWKGMWGEIHEMADGAKVKVDETYVRESILNPTAKVVKGYAPVMPSYAGSLKDDDITAIIEFMKTIK